MADPRLAAGRAPGRTPSWLDTRLVLGVLLVLVSVVVGARVLGRCRRPPAVWVGDPRPRAPARAGRRRPRRRAKVRLFDRGDRYLLAAAPSRSATCCSAASARASWCRATSLVRPDADRADAARGHRAGRARPPAC